MLFSYIGILSLWLACRDKERIDLEPSTMEDTSILESTVDRDGDGYQDSDDCDDENAAIHPSSQSFVMESTITVMERSMRGLRRTFMPIQTMMAMVIPTMFLQRVHSLKVMKRQGTIVMIVTRWSFQVHQGLCNDIDDDCDGSIDEELLTELYYDADGDGHGDPNLIADDCNAQEGYVFLGDDCDDTDP